MVNMCVREDDRVDGGGIKRKCAVPVARFLPSAMKNTAVKKNRAPADCQQVHGAGNGACSTLEFKMHKADCEGEGARRELGIRRMAVS